MRNVMISKALGGTPARNTRQQLAQFKGAVQAFHESERGDNENLGRMLILGLILIPIVVLLITYGGEVTKAVTEAWDKIKFS